MPSVVIPITPEGAIVSVQVGVSQFRETVLVANCQPVPPPLPLRLLVDTGASCTSVFKGLLGPLGLTATGAIAMNTPSTGNVPMICYQYDVSIRFAVARPFPWLFDAVPVAECEPIPGSYQGLLGRDILNSSVMTYNSLGSVLTLSF